MRGGGLYNNTCVGTMKTKAATLKVLIYRDNTNDWRKLTTDDVMQENCGYIHCRLVPLAAGRRDKRLCNETRYWTIQDARVVSRAAIGQRRACA